MSLPAPERTAAQHRQQEQQLSAAKRKWEVNDIPGSLGERRAHGKPLINSFFKSIPINFCMLAIPFAKSSRERRVARGVASQHFTSLGTLRPGVEQKWGPIKRLR